MGTAVDNVENDEGFFNETVNLTPNTSFASSEKNGTSIVYKYKLVRLEGNGRLVPATEDEIMEVKDLLGDEKTDLINKTDTGQNSECVSDEGISSGLPQGESSEGLLQSKDREGTEEVYSPRKSLERLQKAKSEDKICFTYGSPNLSAFMKDNIQCSDQNDRVLSEMELQSEIPSFMRSLVGECSNGADSSKEDVSPSYDWISSLKPDFSRLKGEICLDNLTIRELHKIFRATFGRETTVKDKQWLKRRIAMGLADMPNTSFVIEDNKSVKGVDKMCNYVGGAFTKETTSEETADDKSKDSSIALFKQDGNQSDSETCPRGIFRDHQRRRGDFDTEQMAEKRVRKSTRRYIEELSETVSKYPSSRSISSLKDRRLAPKSQLRSFRRVSPGGRVVITRTVSLAGSRFQVPCVSQVRISRPRENMKALMFQSQEIPWGSEREAMKPASQCVQHEMARGGFRRKHHRAWTLSEVMKLVEGVAKYGAGKWSVIKRLYFPSYSYRTAVDLKDKWRNLLKASSAQTPSDKVGNLRKHGSAPIPAPILFRVRELAEKQQEQLAPNSLLDQDRGKTVNARNTTRLM